MADKPNVVFMLADNIGWGDLSCYGCLNPTPRLDKLASEGIRFTNHNTEAQCTPTRSALMTGRMPVRSGTFTVPLGGSAPYGLAPWEYTSGNLFSDAGYATGMFGKWHLGKVEDRIPTAQGFDEWWGISESSDEAGWTAHPLYPDNFPRPKIKQAVKGKPYEEVDDFNLETRPLMDEKITDKAMDFIRRKHAEGKPFYAYVSFTNNHPPMIAHPDYEDRTDSPHAFAKNLAELDDRAGQILDVLDELGIADDTIVVWASDNGSGATKGESFGTGGYWKGCFGGSWEGSYRTPAMIRWPGKIPAGVVTEEIQDLTGAVIELGQVLRKRVRAVRPVLVIWVSDHRRVVVGERNIGVERFLILCTAADEVDRLVGDLLIHEGPRLQVKVVDLLVGLTLDGFFDLGAREVGGIQRMCSPAGLIGGLADAPPLVEALGGRDPVGDLAEVPLAEHPGGVSGIGEQIPHGVLPRREPVGS
jgi:arylsulfatase